MYKARLLRPSDAPQVFDLFRRSQIARTNQDAFLPNSGFFEYPLEFRDIQERSECPPFSLCLERKGRIISYILAYTREHATKLIESDHADPVITDFSRGDSAALYVDQLFLSPHVPTYMLGRLIDILDFTAQNQGISGLVTAIPQTPWKNVSSTRLALHRGLRRKKVIDSHGVGLGVFTKPYGTLNNNPQSS